jgi:hypothetical protein
MPELKKGYQGPLYYPWYDWAFKYAKSYNFLLGARDGYFGNGEDLFVREMQRRLGIVIDGVFGDRTAAAVHYTWPGTQSPPVVAPRRKIWITSSPGSGADAELGPSHDLGDRCRDVLKLNHQMMRFQKGGYLGLLGGNPAFSYNEVIWDQYHAILSFLDNNADAQEAMRLAYAYLAKKGWREEDVTDSQLVEIAQNLEFEHHHSGYSQSAQGVEEACEYIYGDGGFIHPGDPTQTPSAPGKYRLIRHTLKLVVNFGNPSTPITGIARKTRSPWLARKVRNVNYDNDFYAKVPLSDNIRPTFYAEIVTSEMELPYFVHVIRIAVPIIMKWAATFIPFIGPLLGGFGPMVQLGLGMINGLQGVANDPQMGNLLGLAGSNIDIETTNKLEYLLSPTGVLENIPGLIQLIAALPGLQAHGNYPFDPFMMDQAFNHIASFTR